MAKSLSDILKGVKKSKIEDGSLGKEPGVDYSPKAPAERKFVSFHKVEKHEDRVGNGPEVYSGSKQKEVKGKDKPVNDLAQYKKANEETKSCSNESSCECDDCSSKSKKFLLSSKKKLQEIHVDTLVRYYKKAGSDASKISAKMPYETGDQLKSTVEKHNKRVAGQDLAAKKVFQRAKVNARLKEGAKVDRMAAHIKSSEIEAGKSPEKAKQIAWATLNKRGYLDNKNKKKNESYPSGNVGDNI